MNPRTGRISPQARSLTLRSVAPRSLSPRSLTLRSIAVCGVACLGVGALSASARPPVPGAERAEHAVGLAAASASATVVKRLSLSSGPQVGGQELLITGRNLATPATTTTEARSRPGPPAVTSTTAVSAAGPESVVAPAGTDTGSTRRISVATDGTQTTSDSYYASISADGRLVAFSSSASNLVPGDTNIASDVFVRDTQTGTTTRVSLTANGTQADGASWWPSISADGRHVAFTSSASDLVPGDTNGRNDVFVRDLQTGTTTRASLTDNGTQTDGDNRYPSISADGRHVAFTSGAPDLVPGDTNNSWDVFVRDTQTGTTTRVNVADDDTQANGDSFSEPSISADGRHVAFRSAASNLVPGDTNGAEDVFVRDTLTRTTTRANVADDDTQADSDSYYPSLSADGRLVAFFSSASNLVPGDTNNTSDVFVRDTQTGTTTRVSLSDDDTQGNGHSNYPAISHDGHHVAFLATASDLVPGDTNDVQDVFVRTMNSTTTTTSSTGATSTTGPTTPTTPTGPWIAKTVTFGTGTVNSADVVALSAHALKVTTPAIASSDDTGRAKTPVVVRVGDATKGPKYTYQATGITITPTETCAATSEDVRQGGTANTPVTLTGTNLDTAFTTLTIGGKTIKNPTIAADGTSITVTPPKKLTDIQDLVVRDKRGEPLYAGYCTYQGHFRPSITAVDRTTASTTQPTPVVLTGTDLDRVTTATFDGTKATITKGSPTQITVKIPAGRAVTDAITVSTRYDQTARSPQITRGAATTGN